MALKYWFALTLGLIPVYSTTWAGQIFIYFWWIWNDVQDKYKVVSQHRNFDRTAPLSLYAPQVSNRRGRAQHGQQSSSVVQEPNVVLFIKYLHTHEEGKATVAFTTTHLFFQRDAHSGAHAHLTPAISCIGRYEHAKVGGGQFRSNIA